MKILIATDGSDFSRKAIENACDIVAGSKDEHQIKIISAYEPAAYAGTEPFIISGEYIQEMADIARNQSAGFVDEAEKLVRSRFKNSECLVTTLVVHDLPGKAITEEAQKWNADLIVVGSHGRSFWGRALLGSTSDSVLHHAPCSVLVVRKNANKSAAANRNGAEN